LALGALSTEYKERFDIDFSLAPVPFKDIQELVLARNAGIHRSEEYLEKEYLGQVEKPVFMDDEARFFVTREALILIIAKCETFIKWIVAEVEKLRTP
jgi:hypothetical protein